MLACNPVGLSADLHKEFMICVRALMPFPLLMMGWVVINFKVGVLRFNLK